VTDIKQNSANTALNAAGKPRSSVNEMGSPIALHYKGITITPGGFLAAETVWRQRATASDINTPFNSIPFGGASQSKFIGILSPPDASLVFPCLRRAS